MIDFSKFKSVYKWSWSHRFVRTFTEFGFRLFYRRVYIVNPENRLADKPVIYTPTHQNTLMDALAIGYTNSGQPVYAARADIFKNPKVASILRWLKILPIFRIRDGKDLLKNNDYVFDISVEVLKRKLKYTIYPEGTHQGIHKLRALKKGVCRMAFQAEEANNFELDVHIVPVAIDYSNYFNIKSTLTVTYGEPIRIADYKDLYAENANVAQTNLLKDIAEGIKKVMVHIESPHYDLYNDLRVLYMHEYAADKNLSVKNRPEELAAQKQFIAELNVVEQNEPEAIASLAPKVAEYIKLLADSDLRDWVVRAGKFSVAGLVLQSLAMLALLPVHLYGVLNNYLPYKIPVLFTKSKIKDPQFFSSFQHALSLVTFLIFYAIQTALVAAFTDTWWIPWAYLVGSALAGQFSLYYYLQLKKLRSKWRFSLNKTQAPFSSLVEMRKSIIEKTKGLLDRA